MKKIALYIFAVLILTACGTSKKTTETVEQKWTEEVVDTIYYTVEVVDTIYKTVTKEDQTAESHKENHEQWSDKTVEIEKPDGTKIKYTNRTGERSEVEDNLQRQLKECRDSLVFARKHITDIEGASHKSSGESSATNTKDKGVSIIWKIVLSWLAGVLCGGIWLFAFLLRKK